MDSKKIKTFVTSIVIIFISALVVSDFFSASVAETLPPIKIGVIQSISGMVSDFALDDVEGFQITVDQINEKGGVKTKEGLRKIHVVVRDNKLKPDITIKNAKTLIFEQKCDLLVGCISSACGLAASEWARQNKVLFLGWDFRSHNATQERGHRYFFRSDGNTWMCGHAGAFYFKDKPYNKWGFINPDYAYGHDNVEAFLDGMKKFGRKIEIVSQQWPKLGTTDFTPFITALMSANPEIVHSSCWGTDQMTFIKQAKAYGFFNKVKYFILNGGLPLLRPMGQEMPEGVYVLSEAPFVYPGSPENKAFYDTYKARTGKFPSDYSMLGWLAATFLVTGIDKARTVETEALIDALEGISIKTHLPAGTITIRKCDHQSDIAQTVGITVRDSKWPWLVAKDVTVIPGGPTMMSCDKIMELRAEYAKKIQK